jgi:hypothetical protein
MDELDLIRERAETVGFATADDLAPARARLLAATRTGRPRHSRRWSRAAGATTIGPAAAITAVVTPAPADRIGVGVANADPVKVLSEAAGAALTEPVTAPRPDQFLSVKTEHPDHHTREVWLAPATA